jgi:large subunit ribosomal protein L4
MNVKILDVNGKETGKKVELSDSVFAIDPNQHAMWLDVRVIRANQRQGTHASKGRSEVSGGGKKPFRQKGTGRARQGTSRAPHYPGGGRVFGPHPHAYSIGINKKVKALARRSALSAKAKNDGVMVVEDFSYDAPKTKDLATMLESLKIKGQKILLLTGKNEPSVYLSARNLYRVEVRDSITFSTYDVLNADKIIFQKSAVEKVNEVLGK